MPTLQVIDSKSHASFKKVRLLGKNSLKWTLMPKGSNGPMAIVQQFAAVTKSRTKV